MKIQLSIVIPLANEEGNVGELYKRLAKVLSSIRFRSEIIFVDDGSVDSTLLKLQSIHKRDRRVKILSFSRNFGQTPAITAGLDHAQGELVVVMDGDLQDPPEFIPKLLDKITQGYDVVYAKHLTRNDQWWRRALFRTFYIFLEKLSSFPIPTDVGTFGVMRRSVVLTLSTFSEQNRYLAGLRAWVGFKQVAIPYEKHQRYSGKAPQTFKKLVKMGLDALFSFSYVPLRLATYLGLVVSIFAFIMILNVLYQKFVSQAAILGWASPLISTLFIGGVELLILGIIGEYLGRIYDEVKRRPYYIVSEKIGF